jgi:hypothetical protein
VLLQGLGKLKKKKLNDLIGNNTNNTNVNNIHSADENRYKI